jgi:hypothetical protein
MKLADDAFVIAEHLIVNGTEPDRRLEKIWSDIVLQVVEIVAQDERLCFPD